MSSHTISSIGTNIAPAQQHSDNTPQQSGRITVLDGKSIEAIEKKLYPQGFIAKVVDKIWNRGILALFSSQQRKLNHAIDLTKTLSFETTSALKIMSNIQKKIEQQIQENPKIQPLTFENMDEYILCLGQGKMLAKNKEGVSYSKIFDLNFAIEMQHMKLSSIEAKLSIVSLLTGYSGPRNLSHLLSL